MDPGWLEQTIVDYNCGDACLPTTAWGSCGCHPAGPQGFRRTAENFWEMPGVAVGRVTSDLPYSVTPGSQREGLALQGIGCNWCAEGGRPATAAGSREGGRDGGETWCPRETHEWESWWGLWSVSTGSMVLVWIPWEAEWLRWQQIRGSTV